MTDGSCTRTDNDRTGVRIKAARICIKCRKTDFHCGQEWHFLQNLWIKQEKAVFEGQICLTTKDPGNIIYKSVIVRKCEPKAPASI